ncbi:DUF6790 family protein [Myceligenerans xiligouense]|uniref:Uncharacterized protein n=1 Tax=Myceligenerans xiligouense TaxID=253184 RepID=A0A3N4YSA9_9MICO|nr:DUF6790 family protein [Myceligenerans xiligouense]RPF22274.1 hypothetical protein EDD34_2926 [Myceligenerans xiligouense]
MWIVVIIGGGVLTAVIQMAIQGFPSDQTYVLRTLLLHQFVVSHGFIAVAGFIINVLYPERTAAKLGWPSGPFQIKYGFAQLGLGVMGVMAIWFQGNFWAGVLVTLYIYGLSGLWTHTQEIMRKRRETGRLDWIETGNIVLDVIYHLVLTWMSLQIPGVWSFT